MTPPPAGSGGLWQWPFSHLWGSCRFIYTPPPSSSDSPCSLGTMRPGRKLQTGPFTRRHNGGFPGRWALGAIQRESYLLDLDFINIIIISAALNRGDPNFVWSLEWRMRSGLFRCTGNRVNKEDFWSVECWHVCYGCSSPSVL